MYMCIYIYIYIYTRVEFFQHADCVQTRPGPRQPQNFTTTPLSTGVCEQNCLIYTPCIYIYIYIYIYVYIYIYISYYVCN